MCIKIIWKDIQQNISNVYFAIVTDGCVLFVILCIEMNKTIPETKMETSVS